MIDEPLDELVHRADLDGLVRLVDARCSTRDWDGLLRVRDRARAAVATGRQLWPAATLAEYRLALLAPPEWATRTLGEDAGRFTIGPLTEVIAQHHDWQSLVPFLDPTPRSALIAHERVLRGEDLEHDAVAAELPDVLDLPLRLQDWEPRYPLATYSDAGVDAPPPAWPTSRSAVDLPESFERIDDPDVERAVRQLLDPWTASSNGRVSQVAVVGDHRAALAALGLPRARAAESELSAADALAWLAWAGASGGAQGRRRGGALGRFGAWWLLVALADLTDEWPIEPDELGEIAGTLRWWWFDAGEPVSGWQLQLAIHDPEHDMSWAIAAHDAV